MLDWGTFFSDDHETKPRTMSKRNSDNDAPSPASSTEQARRAARSARLAVTGLVSAVAVALAAGAIVYSITRANAYIGTVDGHRIDKADYDLQMTARRHQIESQFGADLGGPQGQEMLASARRQTIDALIDRQIFLDEAASRGITVTDAEVQTQLGAIRSQFPSEQSFHAALDKAGFSEDALRRQVQDGVLVRKLRDALTKDATVSEAEARAFYNSHQQQFTHPEEVEASHILVKTPAEAAKIEAKLKKGANFASLARKYSIDTGSKNQGGDLGFFPRGRMVPAFEKAAFALQPGQISSPVHTQFGYHIIKGGPHRPASVEPFSKVRTQVIQQLLQQQQDVEFQAWEAKARQRAHVYIRPEFEPLAPATGAGAALGPGSAGSAVPPTTAGATH